MANSDGVDCGVIALSDGITAACVVDTDVIVEELADCLVNFEVVSVVGCVEDCVEDSVVNVDCTASESVSAWVFVLASDMDLVDASRVWRTLSRMSQRTHVVLAL